MVNCRFVAQGMFQLEEINHRERRVSIWSNVDPATLKEFEEMARKNFAGVDPYPTYILSFPPHLRHPLPLMCHHQRPRCRPIRHHRLRLLCHPTPAGMDLGQDRLGVIVARLPEIVPC